MTSENPMLVALENLRETTEILDKSLSDQDLEKAHEAISVMLMRRPRCRSEVCRILIGYGPLAHATGG